MITEEMKEEAARVYPPNSGPDKPYDEEMLAEIVRQTVEEARMITRRLSKVWRSYGMVAKIPTKLQYHIQELQHHLNTSAIELEVWDKFIRDRG